jgi:thiol-disulfide isomerase/thioredoxin
LQKNFAIMKKSIFFPLLAALLAGCGKTHLLKVEGQLGDMASDTILVEYLLPAPRLDTLVAKEGKFTYVLTPDTTTLFTLVVDGHLRIPILSEGEGEVTVTRKGDSWALRTKDKHDPNALLASVHEQLLQVAPQAQKDSAEAFIRRRPDSYVNLYLVDEYFTHDSLPDVPRLKGLINGMNGLLKDTPYLTALSAKLEAMEKAEGQKYLNLVGYTDNKGRAFTAADLRDQYVCVHFWASWGDDNRSAQDSLRAVLKELKQEKFRVVSLSLDMDKQEWLRACPKDSTHWTQLCSFKGWNDEAVKAVGIQRLPATVLLTPDRKMVARDLSARDMVAKVKDLIAEKKRQEAEKKRQEAERKRLQKANR